MNQSTAALSILCLLSTYICFVIQGRLRAGTNIGSGETVALPQTFSEQPRRSIFVGRDVELSQLRRALKPLNIVSKSKPRSCVLQGLGGCGKTNLASEYWYVHGADYEYMWWIPSEDVAFIEQKFAQIAIALDPLRARNHQRENIQITLDWLSTTGQNPYFYPYGNTNQVQSKTGFWFSITQ